MNDSTPDAAPRDEPWLMRTYSGHSTAGASNELYRTNLAKGQTGLSIAFDLPTQTGYDPDDTLARGEVVISFLLLHPCGGDQLVWDLASWG